MASLVSQATQELKQQKLPTSGGRESQLTPYQDSRVKLVIESYGDFSSFCKTFSLEKMQRYCSHPSRCVNGNAPAIVEVKNAYGTPSAKLWMKALVADFAATAVNRSDRRMTEAQLDDWVATALTEWGYLTVTEWMLFFHKAKAGYFGSLYNDVNCIRLSEMVNDFIYGSFRQSMKAKHDEEKAREERELMYNREGTMTFDAFRQTDAYKRIMENGKETNNKKNEYNERT